MPTETRLAKLKNINSAPYTLIWLLCRGAYSFSTAVHREFQSGDYFFKHGKDRKRDFSAFSPSDDETLGHSNDTRKKKQVCLDTLESLLLDYQRELCEKDRKYVSEQLYEIISDIQPNDGEFKSCSLISQGLDFDIPRKLEDIVADHYIYAMSESTRESCLGLLNLELEKLSSFDIKNLSDEIQRIAPPNTDVGNAIQQIQLSAFSQYAPELFTMKFRSIVVPQSTWRRQFEVDYKNFEYVSNAIQVFERNLTNHPSIPFITLIDTPKTGKTRLIAEVAKSIPTIYVSFSTEGPTGYPGRTDKSVEFFEALKTKTKDSDKRIGILRNSLHYVIAKLNDVVAGLPNKGGVYEALWKGQIEERIVLFDPDFITLPVMSRKEREQVWSRFLNLTRNHQSPLKLLLAFDEASYLMKETRSSSDHLLGITLPTTC